MKHPLTIRLFAALLATAAVATALAADSPVRLPLRPGKAPVGDGTYEPTASELKVYLPPRDKAAGAAVVICPGGGYIRHVVDREDAQTVENKTARRRPQAGTGPVVLE